MIKAGWIDFGVDYGGEIGHKNGHNEHEIYYRRVFGAIGVRCGRT